MAVTAAEPARKNPVLAGSVGGVVEWYDFAIYGVLAPILGKLFFPSDDPFTSLLAAFGVFAVGYAARPVGALLFGYLGDRVGRRNALLASIVMMGVCTTLMAMLPTCGQIGVAAPVLLTLLRVLQGLSVGGEFSGSSVYLAEHAPPARRGLITSFTECATVGDLSSARSLHGRGGRLQRLPGSPRRHGADPRDMAGGGHRRSAVAGLVSDRERRDPPRLDRVFARAGRRAHLSRRPRPARPAPQPMKRGISQRGKARIASGKTMMKSSTASIAPRMTATSRSASTILISPMALAISRHSP